MIRFEKIVADAALVMLAIIVVWDVLVFFRWWPGVTITAEIRDSWRAWFFFIMVGIIAGGHFLGGK